jgi:hypothetical protein
MKEINIDKYFDKNVIVKTNDGRGVIKGFVNGGSEAGEDESVPEDQLGIVIPNQRIGAIVSASHIDSIEIDSDQSFDPLNKIKKANQV